MALVASSSRTEKKGNKKKKKGKTSVVKLTGGVAKNKGKAIVREKQGKGKCFHCQGKEHWKRNCPRLLESLKDRKSTRLNSSHSGESRMPSSA